jgi:hypothetical protein
MVHVRNPIRNVQQAYLSLANFFPQEGVARLVPSVVAACRRVLAECAPRPAWQAACTHALSAQCVRRALRCCR